MSSRGWCFTDFVDAEYGVDAASAGDGWERDLLQRVEAGAADLRPEFLIAQMERSPTTGRLHYQGYAYFQRRLGLRAVRGLVLSAHWEPARGSPQQNITYCTKAASRAIGEREPFKFGEAPQQGSRSDLQAVADELKEGASVDAVAERHPTQFIRYHRGIQALRSLHLKQKGSLRRFLSFELILGSPGTGKSTTATARWPSPQAYWARDLPEGWCDQYDGQQVFVLDEFRARFPAAVLLPLLSDAPLLLAVKGGMTTAIVDTVVVTSNLDFRTIAEEYGEPFSRRCEDFGYFWFPASRSVAPDSDLRRSSAVLRWEAGGRYYVPRSADDLESYSLCVNTPYGERKWLRVPFRETHGAV